LSWSPPGAPGGTSLLYDLLRSSNPADFVTLASCVESNDGPNTTATDTAVPSLGAGFFYLVRAESACPPGQGPLGTGSNGAARTCRSCP
jgi:hypothetical protein